MSNMFAQMKQNAGTGFQEMQAALEAQDKGKQDFSDDRFWYPERDKTGASTSIIRFLPTANGDKLPMMKFFSHHKQLPHGWYIEECPTTEINGKQQGECPMCQANDVLWNSGEEGKKQVQNKRKRKMRYVANILVVRDPANPENEGKRFLFQFGLKVHTMIMKAMAGTPDELEPENSIPPCDIFDLWKGKNFTFITKISDKQTNYDDSKFATKTTPLHTVVGGKPKAMPDEELEALWNSQYKLQSDYADKLDYKTYDLLKARLDKGEGKLDKPAPQSSAEAMASAGESLNAAAPGDDLASSPQQQSAAAQDEDEFFKDL